MAFGYLVQNMGKVFFWSDKKEGNADASVGLVSNVAERKGLIYSF